MHIFGFATGAVYLLVLPGKNDRVRDASSCFTTVSHIKSIMEGGLSWQRDKQRHSWASGQNWVIYLLKQPQVHLSATQPTGCSCPQGGRKALSLNNEKLACPLKWQISCFLSSLCSRALHCGNSLKGKWLMQNSWTGCSGSHQSQRWQNLDGDTSMMCVRACLPVSSFRFWLGFGDAMYILDTKGGVMIWASNINWL